MPDIIEQLEAGKKIQEEEGIDIASLRTKVNSEKEQKEEKIKSKHSKKKKEQLKDKNAKIEDSFAQAEQIMNESLELNNKEETKEEKIEKFPGFDFNNYYEKGQKIFYIRVLRKLGIKEFLELKIRTVYPKTIIACEEKKATVCIGPDTKDMIFVDKKLALETYDNVEVTIYKDVNLKDELGDTEIQDMED